MKVIAREIKTFTTVCFTLDELNERLANAVVYTNEPKELTKAGGFGLLYSLTPNQANEIANQLGFRGWDHIGLYDEDRREYEITFYDRKDTMDRVFKED